MKENGPKYVPKKIIAWKPFSPNITQASARLRAFSPCRLLQRQGVSCEILNPKNLKQYQAVIFQKAYQDSDIELAERLKQQGSTVIFDLCDNHLYVPENAPNDIKKTLIERQERLKRMLGFADHITVCSSELGKILQPRSTTIIDDLIEFPKLNPILEQLYRFQKPKKINNVIRLIWYGNSGTEYPRFGMRDLVEILPQLESLHQQYPIQLTVISNDEALFQEQIQPASFPTYYLKWKQHRFPYEFRQHDICLIPIQSNPFTITKTHNRLTLALLLGLPVIANSIPSYVEFKDMFLDPGETQWAESILSYVQNPNQAKRHIQSAHQYISQHYSEEKVLSQWRTFFENKLGITR